MGCNKDYHALKESAVEDILRKEVQKLGGRAYKFVSPGNEGVPDRIVIFPGTTPIFVELKTEKGRLSKLQKVQLKRLEDLGQNVTVIRGVEGVVDFFMAQGYVDTAKDLKKRYGV